MEDFFAQIACPKAVNDPNISCGHFKHSLYWDIIKGKCVPCSDPIDSNPQSEYSSRSTLYVNDFLSTILLLHDGISIVLIFFI